MGLHYLLGLCLAFFSVSSLAALPATAYDIDLINQRYSINNSSVTTPLNVRSFAANDPRIVAKTASGLTQSAPGNLVIADKVKAPFSGSFEVSNPALRQGAKTFFRTAGRLSVVGAGLVSLMDIYDWTFNSDGVLVHPLPIAGSPALKPRNTVLSDYPVHALSPAQISISKEDEPNPRSVPGWYESGDKSFWFYAVEDIGFTHRYWAFPDQLLGSNNNQAYLAAYSNSGPNEYWQDVGGYDYDFVAVEVPVNEQELSDAIDSSYDPMTDDWPELFPFISPDSLAISSFPSVSLDPVVSTSVDALTGNVTVTEVVPSFDFAVNNVPFNKPEITVTESTSTKTYVNGSLVSNTNSSVVSPPVSSSNNPSDLPVSSFELPSFCTWASVICEWLDWTQEPLDDDLDLSQIIIDDDFERDYSFSFGNSTCPEPIVFNVAFINRSVELSYQPACDLAGYAKPFVLISAYIFAIYIALGVVRNG